MNIRDQLTLAIYLYMVLKLIKRVIFNTIKHRRTRNQIEYAQQRFWLKFI